MTERTLVTELDELHDFYVAAINSAVEHDDNRLAERLGRQYDAAATELVAEREGLTHLLPIRRPARAARPGSRSRLARVGRSIDAHTLHAFNAPASHRR